MRLIHSLAPFLDKSWQSWHIWLRFLFCCRCAIDSQPRSLSTQQLAVLAHLAEMVVRRIERDKQILLQQHSKTALLRSLRNQQEAVLLCDTAMHGWPILFTNKSCNDMLGWDEGTLGGRGVWDIFKMGAGSKVRTHNQIWMHVLICMTTVVGS